MFRLVTVVLDRFGQVAVLNKNRELVCTFFVFRDQLSAWMPDGTCFGPASSTGQPPTTDDLQKFGRALTKPLNWGGIIHESGFPFSPPAGERPGHSPVATSYNPDDLVRLLAQFGCDPLPPVFAVADGFLVKLPRPEYTPCGGVLRLRSLANHLFLPVSADLVPSLLPDEAADLVRHRGLVFLPGGRAPGIQSHTARGPIHHPECRCLAAEPVATVAGASPLADRLTEIGLGVPDRTFPPTNCWPLVAKGSALRNRNPRILG